MSADPRLARDPRLSTPQPPPPPAPPPVENDHDATLAASQQILDSGQREEDQGDVSSFKLKFCTVCASNQNRYAFSIPVPPTLCRRPTD